jgi:hypothetical protein
MFIHSSNREKEGCVSLVTLVNISTDILRKYLSGYASVEFEYEMSVFGAC